MAISNLELLILQRERELETMTNSELVSIIGDALDELLSLPRNAASNE